MKIAAEVFCIPFSKSNISKQIRGREEAVPPDLEERIGVAPLLLWWKNARGSFFPNKTGSAHKQCIQSGEETWAGRRAGDKKTGL